MAICNMGCTFLKKATSMVDMTSRSGLVASISFKKGTENAALTIWYVGKNHVLFAKWNSTTIEWT